MNIRRLPLAQQLSAVVLLVTVVVFTVLVVTLSLLSNQAAVKQSETNIQDRVNALGAAIADNIGAARDAAKTGLDVYKKMLPGPITLSEEKAVAGDLPDVPVLKAGNVALNNNLDLLGKVRDLLQSDPAVMVRVGDKFVRVATFLKNNEGKIQTGVPLPVDGPETKSIKEGKVYSGLVNRSGVYYVSHFEPVLHNNEVAGAISIRISVDTILKRVEAAVKAIKVGETGYAFIIAPGKTLEETTFITHPNDKYSGKTLKQVGDPKLDALIQQMVEKKNGTLYYEWATPEGASATKLISLTELKGTNWILGAGTWIDEFTIEARRIRNITIGILVGAAVLLISIAAFFTSRSLAPLSGMAESLTAMGNGDLRQHIPVADPESRDETARLAVALTRMRDGLTSMISQITTATRDMSTAAQEMNTTAHLVMDSSEQQSQSAATLASAVEEVSVSITHVSDNAGDAQKLVTEAAEAAQLGNQRVTSVVKELTAIEENIRETAGVVHQLGERTANITQVIQIIKDIADQTNLLALNAAIEAARAGESGRGFAVVADEVRKLAERTAHSTAEISSTIGTVQTESSDIVRRIEILAHRITEGVSVAHAAGQSLHEIEQENQSAVSAVREIASSTSEQSSATQQIAQGVENIAQMADSNRQASQQNNEGAEHLRCLAEDLNRMVARFQV